MNVVNTTQVIEVNSFTQHIEVNPETQSVSVINAGPVGPAGPVGSGGLPVSYSHDQEDELSSWVINHNLGYSPNVSVSDENGDQINGRVIYHTINQLEIQFNQPRRGVARLT